ELALAEELVEGAGPFAGIAVERADDAVVRAHLDHDPPGQNPFWTMGEIDRLRSLGFECEVRTSGEDCVGEELGGSGRRSRLEDDEFVALKQWGDLSASSFDVGQVGLVSVLERRGNGNNVVVCVRSF